MTVASNIKAIIKEEGLKQYAVAKRAKIPEKQFNALLNGRKVFTIDYLIPICEAIGRSPNDVLGYNNGSGDKICEQLIG